MLWCEGRVWTLGRYDTVVIMEAPDEKTVMKANMSVNGVVTTETTVGLTREKGHKLIQQNTQLLAIKQKYLR